MTGDDRILKPSEIAKAYRISERTVYRWIFNRELPVIKLGPALVRVRAEDVEKFIASRFVAARGEAPAALGAPDDQKFETATGS